MRKQLEIIFQNCLKESIFLNEWKKTEVVLQFFYKQSKFTAADLGLQKLPRWSAL